MEYFKLLSKEFPKEAYSKDSSRGFDLTSLKAQYIKERLNEVFSIWGWKFNDNFQTTQDGILCFGKLSVWKTEDKEKTIREVDACGFSVNKRNMGDTYKGASTDSLSKAASYIGIGNEVFKGNINLNTVTEKKGSAVGANQNNNSQTSYPPKNDIYGICPNCEGFLSKKLSTGNIYCSNWKNCNLKPFKDENIQPLPKNLCNSSKKEMAEFFNKTKEVTTTVEEVFKEGDIPF